MAQVINSQCSGNYYEKNESTDTFCIGFWCFFFFSDICWLRKPCGKAKSAGWDNKGTRVKINGEKVEDGRDLRVEHPKTVVDKDLVVWVRCESESDTEFVFEAKE